MITIKQLGIVKHVLPKVVLLLWIIMANFPSITIGFSPPHCNLKTAVERITTCKSKGVFGRASALKSSKIASSSGQEGIEEFDNTIADQTKIRSNEKRTFVNPATIQFNNQLNRMSRQFDKHSAQQVEKKLKKTLRDVQMGLELEIQPNEVSFVAVINAWSRSRQANAPEKAEEILQWMLRLSALSLTESVSTTLLSSGDDIDGMEVSEDEVDLADFLLIKPNTIAFNAAITAWIRSQKANSHNRAEKLMNQLWDLYIATGQDPDLKPTARTFNLVINAIARSREENCGDRAAALLRKMEDLYVAGDNDMEPEPQTFGAIINAYANCPNDPQSTDKAAQILQQMNSMYQLGYNTKPNTFVYNACLNAFAKSEGNADQAARLLEVMEQQYAKGDVSSKPDVISYSTCINAYANSKSLDSGKLAELLLKGMTERFLIDNDKSCKPNAVAYTAAIKAWKTSIDAAMEDNDKVTEEKRLLIQKEASKRSQDLLQSMCLQYLAGDGSQKPTKVTFDLTQEILKKSMDKDGAERISFLKQRILDHKLPRRDSI